MRKLLNKTKTNVNGAFLLAAVAATMLTGGVLAPLSVAHAADKSSIKVGIMSGEDEDVWREVVKQAAAKGLTVKTVVFNDYNQPNEALQEGEVDANAFQHQPFLNNQIKVNHYDIVRVGDTAVWPIGLYSKKVKLVKDFKDGAVIGVPNDPSNEARALVLLQEQGLLKLKPGAGIAATTADIVANPKHLKIKELDSGVIGRSVPDLDAAVVNTDWALKSGLTPEDRIAQEPIKNNPYTNFIAVKKENVNATWVKTLVSSYQNEPVKTVFNEVYKGTGVTTW
ncbi:MetQ/NlpA family ABC transporter substrate-binding protein [Rouxiella badensis]|jgi:D-methionine transport system substrate-binding protein|uniref:Lipoprotein n=1 Tax=Rouxiella badensis TaxID=1646377 RepID=A0A1X0WH72_9GAMM|nr:MetQ/NlpA family lipoprotein [Rouxiella badensis]MCC3704988.1 MetQ/NlpA family lipoprotein [Rouxiella badensis]MCC3721446.1 MetQ/NlpA family lipoprotein [Rouxiella badensis]MCC3731011.1 MetQ/NlpA family lipoprotein [Rouxiella badensis]MCC3735228.1 MetQ/NlpA family lipoprotein [Rouxiella badensis]MCC3742322.1 MetQ/NlpA family lipoprotein [Rouxiella badensis]